MVFKLDDRRIPVPFTVVLCKDVQCFIILAMRDKPSRRLFYIISSVFLNIYIFIGNQSYLGKNCRTYKNYSGKNNLKPDRNSPAHSSLNSTGSPANKRCGDATKKPKYHINGSHESSKGRMSQLRSV
jgi:hypothetical protein